MDTVFGDLSTILIAQVMFKLPRQRRGKLKVTPAMAGVAGACYPPMGRAAVNSVISRARNSKTLF